MCIPMDKGGLGLRTSMDFNLALLAKLAWQVLTCLDKLWVKIMRDKYIKDGNLFTATIPSSSSWGWKSIMKGRSIVELGAS